MIKNLLYISVVLISTFLNAQNPVYKNYNSNNGLYSPTTNCIVQDKNGIIWIGTKNGLTKFDGYSFKNYTIEDGLLENNIIDFYKDKYDVIWFITNNYNIGYLKNDSIFNYKYNNVIQKNIYANSKYIQNSLSSNYGNVSLAINKRGLFTINKNGIIKSFFLDKLLNGNAIITKNRNKAYIIDSFLDKDTILFANGCKQIIQNNIFSLNKPNNQFAASVKDEFYYISDNNNLLVYKNNNLVKSVALKSKILNITITKNTLWITSISNGIFVFELKNGIPKLVDNFFTEYIVNYIYQDIEGGMWFSTLNNGILYVPDVNRQIISTQKAGKNVIITDMQIINNNIYLSYSNGEIENINTREKIKINDESDNYYNIKLSSNNRNIYALFNNKIYKINNAKTKLIIDLEIYSENINFDNIFVDNSNMIWVSNNRKILKINNNSVEKIFSIDKNINSEITNILKSPEGLFMSVKNGFWKFSNNSYYNYSNKSSIFNTDITNISTDKYGFTTLLSTNGNGLIILAKDSIYSINKNNGILSNIVTTSYFNDSILVIGTNKGIEILTIDNNFNINSHKTYRGNYNNTTNQVNKVITHGKNIYYTTNNNLCKINIKDIKKNEYLPKLIITNILINNKDTVFSDIKPSLKSYENNLTFKFLCTSYRNIDNIKYRYKLGNNHNEWQYTKSTSIDYSFLPSGKHTFFISASNSDGVWGKPIKFAFIIERPLYLKWWFIILSFAILSLIMFFVGRLILKNIKKKESMQKDVLMYRQQALRKQMNPHFIFNSLNSIQHFILQNDKKMSNKYLNRFSKLIRIVLENSQKNIISFDDELSAIELYLEIESLRFKDKFSYSINIDKDIDTANLKIPPLLLQPYLENSIWHGLMNINDERKGILVLKMNKIDDKIICIIEDNGVGRYKAKEIKDKSNRQHKSLAVLITNERVELFNYENNKKITMRYIDKYNIDNIATGTKVEITIPIIY